ncbi:MAG: MgtC/SapB family protein [Methylocystaceae bacterium]
MYLYDLLLQAGLALLVGTVFGLVSFLLGERNAGIRVFAIICVGCCLAAYLSVNFGILTKSPWMVDPTRIAAQLVSAVGFIVAGMIWIHDSQAKGLSSAALLWVTAIMGLMIGCGSYREVIVAAFMIGILLLVIELRYWQWR